MCAFLTVCLHFLSQHGLRLQGTHTFGAALARILALKAWLTCPSPSGLLTVTHEALGSSAGVGGVCFLTTKPHANPTPTSCPLKLILSPAGPMYPVCSLFPHCAPVSHTLI